LIRIYRRVRYNTKNAVSFIRMNRRVPHWCWRDNYSLGIPPFSDDFPVPLNRASDFFASQGLEATLSDSKKKYSDKVSALLSAWEHVTNYIPAAPPEAIQSLIEWAHRWVHVVRRSLLYPRLCDQLSINRDSFREDMYGRREIHRCVIMIISRRITTLKDTRSLYCDF